MTSSITLSRSSMESTKSVFGFALLIIIICLQLYSLHHQSRNEEYLANLQKTTAENSIVYQEIENNLQKITATFIENKDLSKIQSAQVENELHTIQNNISGTATQIQIQALQADITQLHAFLISPQHKNIPSNNNAPTKKQNSNELKKFDTPQHIYLSAKSLPFRVSSIDIWNGTPQATIYDKNGVDLMGKNESRGGWRLVRMSFDTGKVLFQNRHHQFVRLCLT